VIGLASAPLVGFAMPAHADTWRDSEWWLSKLHVIQAWRSGAGAGAGVTVAVLADGVAAGQADLSGRVIAGPDFTRSNRHAGSKYYGVIGTGLASLIAGHGHGSNSASGIYGIARGARILSVRVTLSPGDPLWSRGALTSRLPAAICGGHQVRRQHTERRCDRAAGRPGHARDCPLGRGQGRHRRKRRRASRDHVRHQAQCDAGRTGRR